MDVIKSNKKVVYLLECGEKFYKIGVATSMKKRLSGIKTGNPFPIHVVTKCFIKNAHELEQGIHNRLKNRKVSGEWFKLEPSEVIEVCVLINSSARQNKFFRCKTVLEFGDRKIIDSERKLWNIQRQNIFNEPVEAVGFTTNKEITKPITKDYITEAELLIKQYNIASSSFLQRKLKIGYVKAARIMDELQDKGIIGPPNGSKPRAIISA